jgi:ABC-type amino acid transport substrate-binding protein
VAQKPDTLIRTLARKVFFWKLRSVCASCRTVAKGLVNNEKDSFVTNGDNSVRMRFAHHADLVANSEIGMTWRLRLLGFDPEQVERGPVRVDEGGYYLAFGKGADPQRVAQLRQAFDKAQASGLVEKLRGRYQPDCVKRPAGCAVPAK